MAENIKLRKRNFTVNEGYFFTIEDDRDNLLQKTDDGNTAFAYPLDVGISQTPVSLEFDGVYFWAMMDTGSNMQIQRWKIDNYVCKLQQTINFTSGASHTYDAEAFSVEHYHDTVASGITASGTILPLTLYGDVTALMNFTTTSGDPLTIHLGPNTNGEEEDVYVDSMVGSGIVNLTTPTTYSYEQGDPANFYTYIWMFNNADGTNTATGALYKFDAYRGTYIKKYPGGAYRDVDAATFYRVNSFTAYGPVDTLAYIRSTNTLFINVDEETPQGALPYYGSMVMSNIQSNQFDVLTVYDLAMDDQNVYRLQKGPDGGTGESWSTYSYELSSLDSFVTSIALAAYPAIIAANGVSTTDVIAIVKDQFLQPIVGRLVYFTENGTGSIVGGTPINTDGDGLSQTIYRAGTTAQEVKITATVEQT